jgi:hypothetical protein
MPLLSVTWGFITGIVSTTDPMLGESVTSVSLAVLLQDVRISTAATPADDSFFLMFLVFGCAFCTKVKSAAVFFNLH